MAAGDALDAVSAEFYYTGRFQPIAGADRDPVDRQQQSRGARDTTDLENNRGNSLKKPVDCSVHRSGYLYRGGSLREKADTISTVADIYRHGRCGQVYTAMAADCGIYCTHADSPRRRGEKVSCVQDNPPAAQEMAAAVADRADRIGGADLSWQPRSDRQGQEEREERFY